MFGHISSRTDGFLANKRKTDFISSVSHELRTPLALVKEGVNLIYEGLVGKVSEEQKKVLFEVEHRIHRDLQGRGRNLVVAMKRKAGQAPVSRDILVLLADRFAQPIDLDLAGRFRQILWVNQLSMVR